MDPKGNPPLGRDGLCAAREGHGAFVQSPSGPENVAEAAHGTDEARLRRVGLDLLADAVDPHVDGTVERVRVPCIGEIEQPVAGEDALRHCR